MGFLAHHVMHDDMVCSVCAWWHAKEWAQYAWQQPVQPVKTCMGKTHTSPRIASMDGTRKGDPVDR